MDKFLSPEVIGEFELIDFDHIANLAASADWIFVDGGPRNFYTNFVLRYVKEESIFVLDNTDETYTKCSRDALKQAGYAEIPFHSLGPLNPFSWSTSVFVKSFDSLRD
jgi:hypothetical protein